jgi:methionine synthase I (cobalamin-dependent)
VSEEFGCLWLGGVCQTPTYLSNGTKEKVQEEFRKQTKVFFENGADFLLAEVIQSFPRLKRLSKAPCSMHAVLPL